MQVELMEYKNQCKRLKEAYDLEKRIEDNLK